MTSKTVIARCAHKDFVEGCAARAIQAVARGYFTRMWFCSEWGDSDDEEDHMTTTDLLRLTSGRSIGGGGAYYGRHPQAVVDDLGNPFRALSESRISASGGEGLWVNPECGVPRRVTECPCCYSRKLVVRGFSGGGVGVDENVYCGSCSEYLGVEL